MTGPFPGGWRGPAIPEDTPGNQSYMERLSGRVLPAASSRLRTMLPRRRESAEYPHLIFFCFCVCSSLYMEIPPRAGVLSSIWGVWWVAKLTVLPAVYLAIPQTVSPTIRPSPRPSPPSSPDPQSHLSQTHLNISPESLKHAARVIQQGDYDSWMPTTRHLADY